MCKRAIAIAFAFFLSTASFGDIVYSLNDVLTQEITLAGFLQTDGTFGVLGEQNIVSFDIAVTGLGDTANNISDFIFGLGTALTAHPGSWRIRPARLAHEKEGASSLI